MSVSIDVENTRFFIALAKQSSHSFLMLGIHKDNKVEHLLCRVGKFFDVSKNAPLHTICSHLVKALFSSTKAVIEDEGLARAKRAHTPISYQAFDISFAQYIEFIELLESLETDTNQFGCYKPVSSHTNFYNLEFTRRKLGKQRPLGSKLRGATSSISINNTCRHGAMQLIEEVLHTSVASHVSSHFFVELPGKSYLDFGLPSNQVPFFVLPAPPGAYVLNQQQKKVVELLYKRMERMIELEPHATETENKFSCLKNLYKQLVGSQELGFAELIQSIQYWKQNNFHTLNVLRKTYFWDEFITRKSATLKTIETIEHDLQSHAERLGCRKGG